MNETVAAQRKPTKQQRAVVAALADVDEFISAQNLHAQLRAQGSTIGLATVYRALQSMSDAGTVDVLRSDDGEASYRACSTHHHHHVVCRDCGRTVEVEAPSVEQWAASVGEQHGFRDVSHTVEVFGVCEDCWRQRQGGAAV